MNKSTKFYLYFLAISLLFFSLLISRQCALVKENKDKPSKKNDTSDQQVVTTSNNVPDQTEKLGDSFHLRKLDSPLSNLSLLTHHDGAGSVVYFKEKQIDLNLTTKDCTGYKWSPARKYLLAEYGEHNPIIYNDSGEQVTEITRPIGRATAWRWRNDAELIGAHVCENEQQSLQDEECENQMINASRVEIYIYMLESETKLHKIELPEVSSDHVIQLDGVTKEGNVVLSSVKSEFYDQGDLSHNLGVFEVIYSSQNK